MIALRHPLLMLLAVPLVVWAWRVVYRWGIPSSRPSSRLARLTSHWIPILLALALGLAAAGPEWRTPLRGIAPVVDLAVVLDGSSSMRILDRPDEDRWHAARRTLAQFVLRRPDDRFALILFSAHPVTLSPLTADHLRLLRMLARLDIDSRDDGTAIGSALMTAVRRLEDSPARSRVILLITDGVQNRGRVTPLEAAEEARRNGIRIHAVAIGSNGESLVPLEGGGFARLRVEVDHATLQQVAHLTGGESFSAEDPAGLENSLASVDRLEKTLLPVDPPTEGRPMALWCLLAAALLALPLAVDLAFKRGRPRPAWVEGP
ncbi:MAG: VWA domain-containing protein [Geothrix sp.]|uniref:VWA domain-containing protein n=1 Tax=Geothrix sp. TaxID=1962974 RepID=UPI0017ED7C43|nr:VWA domain-containing protein [Geothrix sp.]NWJ40159.1 VWA domain-containing protein [Geothrix sp.]WIL21832.1 MAG: VWA domain-containing protein [Geothrix sp.]